MNQQSFLILHGLGGSGPDHWQTWLYHELTKRHYPVFYPTFSNFNSPNKKVWLEELFSAIEKIPEQQKLTVITHSLGCLLWLHYTAVQNKQIANHVILVAPPSPTIVLPEAKSFYPLPLNGNHLLSAANDTLFVHSTNDPYCSIEDSNHYSKLGVPSLEFPNMGHINTNSGHGKWPWVLEYCLNTSKSTISI
jgi:uncharacterized protein